MATNSADYYMLVNEWVWSKSQDCLLRLEVDMCSVLESAWTEMEIRWVKGMCGLKVVRPLSTLLEGFNWPSLSSW